MLCPTLEKLVETVESLVMSKQSFLNLLSHRKQNHPNQTPKFDISQKQGIYLNKALF